MWLLDGRFRAGKGCMTEHALERQPERDCVSTPPDLAGLWLRLLEVCIQPEHQRALAFKGCVESCPVRHAVLRPRCLLMDGACQFAGPRLHPSAGLCTNADLTPPVHRMARQGNATTHPGFCHARQTVRRDTDVQNPASAGRACAGLSALREGSGVRAVIRFSARRSEDARRVKHPCAQQPRRQHAAAAVVR